MALTKQLLPLSYGGGLDTKTDPSSVPLGKWLTLENCVFTHPKSLRKRNGFASMVTGILGGGSISAGAMLATRGNELLLGDGSSLYSYDQANTAWVSKGTLQQPTLSSIAGITANEQLVGYDCALHSNGLLCVIAEIGLTSAVSPVINQGVAYTVIDTTTGQTVVPLTLLEPGTQTSNPRVCVLGGYFFMVWRRWVAGGVYAQAVSVAAPQTLVYGSPQAVTSGVGTSADAANDAAHRHDLTVQNGIAYLAFTNRSGTTTIFGITAASPYSQPYTAVVAGTAPQSICVVGNRFNNDVVVGITQGNNKATAFAYNGTLVSQTLAPTDIDTGQSNVDSITAISTSASATAIRFFVGCGQGAPISCYIRKVALGAAYAVGSASTLNRSVVPAGKPIQYGTAVYLPAWFTSKGLATNLQSTWFLLNTSGKAIAKAFPGYASGYFALGEPWLQGSKYAVLPSSVSPASGKFYIPIGNSIRILNASPSSTTSQFGVSVVQVDFTDTANPYTRASLAGELVIGGACPQMYDGATAAEHGFSVYPENLSGTTGGSATGSLSAGSYQYVAVYEWVDAQGIVHRSAPSPALTKTTVNTDSVTVTIPTLRLTNKTNVLIQLYRTAVNGTTFYRITGNGIGDIINNDTTVDTVSRNDTASDASIAGFAQLYTEGGELPASAPPALHSVVAHRSRIFGINPTTGEIVYSKIVAASSPVEFADGQTMAVDGRGGNPTALASLDEKLIIFKSDRIFMVAGQGPDSAGGNNDFSDAMLVSSDTGCSAPKSIVVVPDGIMFKSPKGIYLLDRALRVSYIGADVESYNSASVTSAVLQPGSNQVRFTLDNGKALVYDYFVGQWSVFTNVSAVDSVIWGSTHTYLTSAGLANQETAGVFSDPGSAFIAMKAISPWIQLAQIQGFQRIYRVLLLGDYVSPHQLTVKMAYDFAATFAQTDSVSISADANPYQYRFHCAKQKCEAFQISVEDVSTGTLGESMVLSGLMIEAGIKRGAYKIPASQSHG